MYTLVFRKGNVELEFLTDDKVIIERQLAKIIQQASGSCEESEKNIGNENDNDFANVPVKESIDALTNNNLEDVDSERIDSLSVKTVEFEQIDKNDEKLIVNNNEHSEVIPTTLDVASIKPITINSLQNPEPQPEVDFDKILNSEMNFQSDESPILKDERFINYVEGKSALEKIDFLVITAQYLAQYENLNTFNLKHINAKLMQNFTIIVDHSVLQSAISREFITRIHEGYDEGLTEYMLTEKGQRSY